MGDLTAERMTAAEPFANTGIDFAGPRMRKPSKKTYSAFFVCFSTRAFHLELVSDSTKEACLAALKRFVARRGTPERLFTDNGTICIGAGNDLKRVKAILARQPEKTLSKNVSICGLDWVTIPPRARHVGGLWYAAVKSMKHHLRQVIGQQVLSFEELNTILVQVEGTFNSRPLTAASDDPIDLQVKTPVHFLTGGSIQEPPEQMKEVDKTSTTEARLLEALAQRLSVNASGAQERDPERPAVQARRPGATCRGQPTANAIETGKNRGSFNWKR